MGNFFGDFLNNTISEKKDRPEYTDKQCVCSYYAYYPVKLHNKPKNNLKNILKLPIQNLHIINGTSVRGESLSHKKNIKYLSAMKNYGIKQIIDLKTADFSGKFLILANKNGLDYHHYEIDSQVTPTREIIDKLPSFFEQMNKGHYYIACAQGMHRTDIAMSINYVFNPKASSEPPVLYGHKTKNGLRFNDIATRLNSIYKELTLEDRKKLGLENFDENTFKTKKKALISKNT